MKKSITVIVMAISISGMLMACGGSTKETSIATKASGESTITETSSSEITEENDSLSFGFTPEEFYDNFSNFASHLDITTDNLQYVEESSYGFYAYSASGEKMLIMIFTDSKKMVTAIALGDINNSAFLNFAYAAISATDTNINFDDASNALDFKHIPDTADELRQWRNRGIALTYASSGFCLLRDPNSPDEYSYTKITSKPKVNAATDITSRSQDNISEVTQGQKNALSKARDYLNYSSFSYSGLIKQLEYEGFSTEEASYASDNCGVDWKEQASEKALDYLSYSAFSYNGLIKQLEYEGFSSDEASFAADSCGADWNEQAAKKAQDYLNYSSFSSSSLIKQLEYEGFTKEQAEYGVSAVGY